MTGIDPKALEHACQCAGRSVHHFDRMVLDLPLRASIVAHARAIEQHEAFRQEVSDAVVEAFGDGVHPSIEEPLRRFIIAKPAPLEKILAEKFGCASPVRADQLREGLKARGFEIKEIKS